MILISCDGCMKWYWSHAMAVWSDINLMLWLYGVISISCYSCRKWYWSHAMAVWSDINLILWLYELILISCYSCRKWYWSHVMSLDFDALEHSLSSVQHKFIKVLVVSSRDLRFCFVCTVNSCIYGCWPRVLFRHFGDEDSSHMIYSAFDISVWYT